MRETPGADLVEDEQRRLAPERTQERIGHTGDRVAPRPKAPAVEGRAAPRPGDRRKRVTHGDVLAAQQVPLAGPPALERCEVAGGHILDRHHVQRAARQIRARAPARHVRHHLAGGSRAPIAGADGDGRVDDEHLGALAGRLQGEALAL